MLTLVDCGLPVKTRISVKAPTGSSVTVEFASTDEPQIDEYTPLNGDIEVAFSLHVSLMWQSDLARSPAGLAEVAEV
jgi:hypothetical protein